MATIVQPYNPWREQLALNALGSVAGNIIGDLWTQHRQSEQNKKANAFIGALQQNLSGGNDISFTQPQLPQGYNSNPWASAFHANNSPIAQFDAATAHRTPSIQDIARNADSLAATPRFSMLNPDTVQAVKSNMIQMAEAERLRGLQESYANQFGAASNPMERMNVLTQSVMNGGVSPNVLNPYSEVARHMTMSPYQAASLQNARDIANIEANSRVNVANIGASADNYRTDALMRGQDLDYRTDNRRLDIQEANTQWERDNPTLETVQDEEGNYYTRNPRSSKVTAMTDDADTHIAGVTGKYPALDSALKAIDSEGKELDKELEVLKSMLNTAEDSDRPYYEQEIEKTRQKIASLSERRKALVERMLPKKKQSTTPATTSRTPTIAEVAAMATSADVAPETTQPNTQQPAMRHNRYMGDLVNFQNPLPSNISDDITTPQEPFIAPAPMSNMPIQTEQFVSPDIKTVAQAAKAHAAQAQKTPATKLDPNLDIRIPNEAFYDPSRDMSVPKENIKTWEDLSILAKKYQAKLKQKGRNVTIQEIINDFIEHGGKIIHKEN